MHDTQDTKQQKITYKQKITKWLAPYLDLSGFALDISDRSIKFIKLGTRHNRITIDHYGELILPENVIVDSEIRQEQQLIAILTEFYQKERHRLKTPFCILSLPDEKGFLRIVQFPKMKPQDIGNAVRWEIENQIPLPADDIIYDYEVMEPFVDNLDHLDIILAAFPKTIVDPYVRVLKSAGIQPMAIEIESQAVVRASILHLRDIGASMILDIGRKQTSLIIFSGGAIIYSATIKIGGEMMEEAIAKALKLTSDQALQVREHVGMNKQEYKGQLFTILMPLASIIADEIVKAMMYYRGHTAHTHGASPDIEKILLSGGTANTPGLDTYLCGVAKIPVVRVDPLAGIRDRMSYTIPPMMRRQTLAFTTALGQAMRNIRKT